MKRLAIVGLTVAALGATAAGYTESAHVEPEIATPHLNLALGTTFAPVVGADGETMVGPDGRERCIAIDPPPPALAVQPNPDPPGPGVGYSVQDTASGQSVTIADRPLTLADTVPCP